MAAPPSDNGKCWNGTTLGTYEKNLTTTGRSLSESPLINEQIFALQVLTDKLRKAHQGDDVEIIDDAEEIVDGSGSGSGNGPDSEGEEEDTEVSVNNNNDDDIVIPAEEFPPEHTQHPPVVENNTPPHHNNNNDNIIPEVIQQTTTYSKANTISLSKALAQYLIPIVLVWFGGAISDLL